MLKAVFYKENGRFTGFSISGHAGYGTEGNDIVCAAITSAVELTCNTITEFFGTSARVDVFENEVRLVLNGQHEPSQQLLASLCAHIENIASEHKKIKLEIK
ncbi:MAG: ribosomal-processing cysteine protease Prp [Oscillospiraceae bacterium]|nr:ribosomal-processing cysteine protease Prp [Oscillospiraceae bacterium]